MCLFSPLCKNDQEEAAIRGFTDSKHASKETLVRTREEHEDENLLEHGADLTVLLRNYISESWNILKVTE